MQITYFILGIVIGGLVSWVITHKYYEKSSRDQKKLLAKFFKELKETNTLNYFEFLLENSVWTKEHVGNKAIWIAKEDNTFQIEIGEPSGEFGEPWTKHYPNKNSRGYPVYLKINNTTIKELTFVSVDGGGIFVPLPEIGSENGKNYYFWDMQKLELKVCNIIGHYYIHRNISNIAKVSEIKIVNKIYK